MKPQACTLQNHLLRSGDQYSSLLSVITTSRLVLWLRLSHWSKRLKNFSWVSVWMCHVGKRAARFLLWKRTCRLVCSSCRKLHLQPCMRENLQLGVMRRNTGPPGEETAASSKSRLHGPPLPPSLHQAINLGAIQLGDSHWLLSWTNICFLQEQTTTPMPQWEFPQLISNFALHGATKIPPPNHQSLPADVLYYGGLCAHPGTGARDKTCLHI